jgi:hypothetical protein
MARVPVRVTLINGLDEVMVHRGDIVADAVIDTRHFSQRHATGPDRPALG